MEAWTYLSRVIKYMTVKGFEPATTGKERSPSLAKWLSVCLRCKWLFVLLPLKSIKLRILCLSWTRSTSTVKQSQDVDFLYMCIWHTIIKWVILNRAPTHFHALPPTPIHTSSLPFTPIYSHPRLLIFNSLELIFVFSPHFHSCLPHSYSF